MKSKKNIKKLRNNKSKINKKNKRKLKSNRKTNKKITGGANKPFTVTVTSDAHGEQEVHVIYTDKIHNAITRAFGFRENEKVLEVSYGDEPVDSHESFKDIGIEDGGRLSVVILDRENVVRDLEAAIEVESDDQTKVRLERWHKTMTTPDKDEDYKKFACKLAIIFLTKNK